ncbi:MAG: thioredoxin family protein [Acidobacteriota bacterium]
MRRTAILAPVLFLSVAAAAGAETPRPAGELLAQASATAHASGRNVMVAFHASWCGYCRKLKALLADPDFANTFRNSYEVVWLDVLEREGKEHLENPGGRELMSTLGGSGGLPFVAVLTPDGGLKGTNDGIGYPVAPAEIDAFLAMLKTTGPRITEADLARLRARLTAK